MAQAWAYDVTSDAEGNVYTCGRIKDTIPGYRDDLFIAKYDVSGSLLWRKTAGGSRIDVAQALTVDKQGNVYVTGYIGEAFSMIPNDTVFFDNKYITVNGGYSDIFIAKYDNAGNVVWVKSYGGNYYDYGWLRHCL